MLTTLTIMALMVLLITLFVRSVSFDFKWMRSSREDEKEGESMNTVTYTPDNVRVEIKHYGPVFRWHYQKGRVKRSGWGFGRGDISVLTGGIYVGYRKIS